MAAASPLRLELIVSGGAAASPSTSSRSSHERSSTCSTLRVIGQLRSRLRGFRALLGSQSRSQEGRGESQGVRPRGVYYETVTQGLDAISVACRRALVQLHAEEQTLAPYRVHTADLRSPVLNASPALLARAGASISSITSRVAAAADAASG